MRSRSGFTLIELLVVVGIISTLIGIIVPTVSRARAQAAATVCSSNLRTVGQGIVMYANDNRDRLVPGRLPKVDNTHWQVQIAGGLKYRPTFLAMLGDEVGVPPFADPQPTKHTVDREGEPGDQQNYASDVYVCPSVRTWTDERNGAYGYNYQFLGNSRLRDSGDATSFRNWPVNLTLIRSPAACVAVGDCLGTAASFPNGKRVEYSNNARDAAGYGNEGFNLDPPTVDPNVGEMAGFDDSPQVRTAVHPRHLGRASILWMDGHCTAETFGALGYSVSHDGLVGMTGNNRLWSIDHQDRAWVSQ